MALSDYRQTKAWRTAIDLGPQLLRLAEELPAAEEMGLSLALRQASVELPAGIAADVLQSRQPRLADALKIAAALELIDRVYPALDTAAARTAVDGLLEQLTGGSAAERPESATPTATAGATATPTITHTGAPRFSITAQPPSPEVSGAPEPGGSPAVGSAGASSTPEEAHVQPNNSQ